MRQTLYGFLALALAFLPSQVNAQEPTTITGRVTSEYGNPLASASVFVEGTKLGTLTKPDGQYMLIVPASEHGRTVTLTATILGHKSSTATVTLSGGSISKDFVLGMDVLLMEEIVVTGAGTETKRSKLGNTINTVKGTDILKSNEVNIISALASKAPNVEVSAQSGDPGASSYVRIRGVKTIQGSGQPLIVVDGVPIDNSTISTGSFLSSTAAPNRASDINPSDIESIEILKGAAAAAIYGSRAAPGVILITTKSGKPGKTQFSFRTNYSFDEVNKTIPLQTKFGQGVNGNAANCKADGCRMSPFSWGAELPEGTPTFDHFGEMFRTGHVFDNTLTASGGSDLTTWYLSAGRMRHEGTIVGPNNWYERTSVRLKASHQLLDNLRAGGNLSYVNTDGAFIQKGSNVSGLLLGALRTPPEFDNKEYKAENGLHRSYRYPRPTLLATTRGYDNPFFVVNEHVNTGTANRMIGNVDLDYTPVDGVRVKYTLGSDYTADERLEALPPSSSGWATGMLNRADFVTHQLDSNLTANFERELTENIFSSFVLGHNFNSRHYRQLYVTGYDYVAPDVHKLDNTISWEPDEYEALVHTESYFGQANFDVIDQVYLSLGLRNDGSSTFGASQRRHWYPKASAAWEFTKKTGEIGDGILTYGKLRAAYGETGRQPDAYQVLTAYSTSNFFDGGWGPFSKPTVNGRGGLHTSTLMGQENLRPERTKEFEAGVDLSLFKQRVAVGLTYYNARSEDVIFTAPLAPSSGFTMQVKNAATISNKGLEATVDVVAFQNKDVKWDLGVQWATNDNLVESLDDAEFVPMGGAFAGNPGAAVKGYPVGVLRGNDFARCGRGLVIGGVNIDEQCGSAPAGALYIDEKGFPIMDPTLRVIMNPHADWTGGIRSSLTLKDKLTFSGLVDVKKGGQVWNGTRGALYVFGTHKDTEVRGQTRVFGQKGFHEGAVAGPGAGTEVTVGQSWFTGLGGGFGPVGAQFIEDGSFVKLRELSVAYKLDAPVVQKLGLSSMDLRVSGRNLLTLTDYTGIDPETNLAGAETSLRGIDYFNNPQTRSLVISVGLNR